MIKSLNPTWQDLADGWGGKAELQIPHFVRDDNKFENGDKRFEDKELQIPHFVRDDNKFQNGNKGLEDKELQIPHFVRDDNKFQNGDKGFEDAELQIPRFARDDKRVEGTEASESRRQTLALEVTLAAQNLKVKD